MSGKRFVLVKRSDRRVDVLGGPVSINNVYVSVYPKIEPGHPMVDDLHVGQHTDVVISLSGETGEYSIRRVDDDHLIYSLRFGDS